MPLKLLSRHLVEALAHRLAEERLDAVLEVDRVVLRLDEYVEADHARLGATAGRDEVAELLLGPQIVEARLVRDLGKERGKGSQLVVRRRADLKVVVDTRVGVDLVGKWNLPDVGGRCEEDTKVRLATFVDDGVNERTYPQGGTGKRRTPSLPPSAFWG